MLPKGNTFTPETYDFRLMLWCDSAWGSRLRAFIGGRQAETDYCEPAGRRGEFFPGVHSQPLRDKQRLWQETYGVHVGTPVTVTVTVHAGRDEDPDPQPPTATGTARLLRYEAVAFTDYPIPDPPRTVHRVGAGAAPSDGSVINVRDAVELASDGSPVDSLYPFSVTRQAGRDVEVRLDAHGPGVLRIVVDQRVEVFVMEYRDWRASGWTFRIDQALLPPGRSVAVGVVAEHFRAPVWRVTAIDVPGQASGR